MVELENSTDSKERNAFGLTDRDMRTLRQILSSYSEVQKVFIFGSRAKGTYKSGSDIDLAIMNGGVNDLVVRKISSDFEESSLPYRVDVINYLALKHPELKSHIDRVGVLFYEQTSL